MTVAEGLPAEFVGFKLECVGAWREPGFAVNPAGK
jgi:hypothetical protein